MPEVTPAVQRRHSFGGFDRVISLSGDAQAIGSAELIRKPTSAGTKANPKHDQQSRRFEQLLHGPFGHYPAANRSAATIKLY